jgi:mannose-6-phosphate isomerase
MREIAFLKNTIQPYPWGSSTAISELLGVPNPAGQPQAELWMGAHPMAPSQVRVGDAWIPLDVLIERDPEAILGPKVAAGFNRRLPFLFKVLAAADPLSIQAHPNREQAREGFERENRQGLPLDAPQRNYRDPNCKPECICALTPFWVMCGFRPPATILAGLRRLSPRALAVEIGDFAAQCDATGLRRLFAALLALNSGRRRQAVDEALLHAARWTDDARVWIAPLARHYPADIGVLAPALMNVIRLEPGQALFLAAGVLHSYLKGTGIEIMANSDNVVRGGLTSKPVDILELMKLLNFDRQDIQMVRGSSVTPTEKIYQTPAREFSLSMIELRRAEAFQSGGVRNIEILLCIDGHAQIREVAAGKNLLELPKGASALVPASAPVYRITGPTRIFKATVPGPVSVLDKTKRFK